jgi:hypothetical protein
MTTDTAVAVDEDLELIGLVEVGPQLVARALLHEIGDRRSFGEVGLLALMAIFTHELSAKVSIGAVGTAPTPSQRFFYGGDGCHAGSPVFFIITLGFISR